MLEVGTIAKPHGLRGEVIVNLSSDRTERLAAGTVLQTDRGPMTVVRAVPHQHRWRVQFEGLASREAAEAVHGLVLRADALDDPDAWFIHDLIDSPVALADGTQVGVCIGVLENPAYDVLELDTGALVPMPFVVSFDDGGIVIEPPEGLLELADDA